MAHMDIFNDDAFSTVELTGALNRVPHKPGFLGGLGIFTPKPVRTLTVSVEEQAGKLSLVPVTERGAPLPQAEKGKRKIRDFRTVRVAKGSKIRADEIQGIRAFGQESELKQVQDEVMSRMTDLRNDVDLTHENMMLGAIQGIVTDADGSVIRNWFTEWSITQPTEIDFDLDAATPASGAVKKKCNEVIRGMFKAAKGSFTPGTQIIGLCGDAFYDDLTTHSEVIKTFLNQQSANDLREGYAPVFESFRYGGITWVNYRGTDDGEVAVGTDKVKFFPVGAKDIFQKAMSPGESFDWVNTPGLPEYALIIPDEKRNTHVDVEVYSYPLYICTTPGVLYRGKRT